MICVGRKTHVISDNMAPLTVVDVFSGIGGIGCALRGVTKSVLYCERDVPCQHVLLARMEDGRLDAAPIHSDIRMKSFTCL